MARTVFAYLTFPVLMGGFVWLAIWGFNQGWPPAAWGVGLTLLNFFVLAGCEQLLPRHTTMNLLRDRQSLNDMGHGLLLAAVARPLGSAISIALIGLLAELRSGLGTGGLWPMEWPFALQFALAFLLWTFADYWIHRSMHSWNRLWWFHAVHHDTPQMHILKSGRLHFGDELYGALLKPIPLLVLGAPPEILVLIGLWIVFDGNLVHSNVDQRFPSWAHYFLPTVQLHNLHHATQREYQDSNYSGSTPLWDVLFGTFNHPDRSKLGEMGIENSPVPSGFLAQVWFPFRAQGPSPR
jgi:sterol desaturase/sphingolipid hydroxylase (fatty acid hydroxylase superfamily)